MEEPQDIDQAVYEVVNFVKTRRRPVLKETGNEKDRRPTRMVRDPDTLDSEAEVKIKVTVKLTECTHGKTNINKLSNHISAVLCLYQAVSNF